VCRENESSDEEAAWSQLEIEKIQDHLQLTRFSPDRLSIEYTDKSKDILKAHFTKAFAIDEAAEMLSAEFFGVYQSLFELLLAPSKRYRRVKQLSIPIWNRLRNHFYKQSELG
jgi:hypothetical protein